jgi:hypothetical protein
VTQATSFLEAKAKTIFDIGCEKPCTKHGHHTFYPCLAFAKAYAQLKTLVVIQKRHLHRKQLAKNEFFEEVSYYNPNFVTCRRYVLVAP